MGIEVRVGIAAGVVAALFIWLYLAEQSAERAKAEAANNASRHRRSRLKKGPPWPAIGATVERRDMRVLAAYFMDEAIELVAAGASVPRARLDQLDRINEYLQGRPEAERPRFRETYDQEVAALTHELQTPNESELAARKAAEQQVALIILVVGFVLLAFVFLPEF